MSDKTADYNVSSDVEVAFGAFYDIIEDPHMSNVIMMNPVEKKITCRNEFENGRLIIDYALQTDDLNDAEKTHLSDIYQFDLQWKYNIINKSNVASATFFDALFGKYEWTHDQIYLNHIFETYNNLQPVLKTAEGKTSSDFKAALKPMRKEYWSRMKPILEQEKQEAMQRRRTTEARMREEKKADKLKDKLESLIPQRKAFGTGYWSKYDETYTDAVDEISKDIETYIESVDGNLNQFFANYNETFIAYKEKVDAIQTGFKQKMKSKEFRTELKSKEKDEKNWRKARRCLGELKRFKINEQAYVYKCNGRSYVYDNDHKAKIDEIIQHIKKDIESVTPETAESFLRNYKDIKIKYEGQIKEAEKEIRTKIRKKVKASEARYREERKAKWNQHKGEIKDKLYSWFKPKIKNGRNPI